MSYNQQTLDAMKIIVNSELDKRKYDITLVCEIIGEDENNKNRFLVKSDSMKFYAMLQNTDGYTTYRIGDTVNVLVPNGDYTQTKFITGKYSSYDEIPKESDVLHPSIGFAAVRSVDSFELQEGKYVPTSTDHLSGRAHVFKKEGKTLYIYLYTELSSTIEDFAIAITIDDETIAWYSKDMIGNVSQMTGAFPQEVLLTSEGMQSINSIEKEKVSIKIFEYNSNTKKYDIHITNSEEKVKLFNTSCAIGYLTKNIEDGVYIYTEDDNYEYKDPASKNIYAFVIKDKQFIFPSTNNTFYWYLYTEGYSTTEDVTSEENKILWKKIDYINPIQLHVDTITSTIKVEYIEEKKIVYSTTQQFTNGNYSENAKGSGTLLLTTDQTYCPIYDNYGNAIINEKKVVTAKRGDLAPFNTNSTDVRIGEKFITWKFNLESQIKFPYSIVKKEQEGSISYEWYPELSNDYSIYQSTDKGIIKIEPDDKEWYAPESGFAYVTQKISDPAAAPSISFYFKDEFSLDQDNMLIAFTHTDEIPNEENYVNKGEISFTLGFGDNSGTGYAFNIINEDKEHPFFTDTGSEYAKTFSVMLQNKNGEQIDLSEYQDKIRWTWLYDELHQIEDYNLLGYSKENKTTDLYYQIFSENQKRDGLYKKENNEYIEITKWPMANQDVYTKKSTPLGKTCVVEYVKGIEDLSSNTIKYNFHVLVATLQGFVIENGQMINLQAFYPIGITGKDQVISSLQGSTYAIYDSFGKLSNLNDKDKKYVINNNVDITKIIQYTFDSEENFKSNELTAPFTSLFSDMWEPTPVSICLYNNNDKLLYIPLLSIQNTWFSQNINAWDGKLNIDNEGNCILSAMIGAGSKNTNNQFTGVIMGDVGKDIYNAESGIYGFKDGKRTFSVGAKNGDAYFNGTIYAGAGNIGDWEINQQSYFDGNFNTRVYTPKNNTRPGIGICSSTSTGDPAFWAGYVGMGGSPWENEGEESWNTNTKFYVTQEGNLKAQGANIEGAINVTRGGTIGFCQVGTESISNGSPVIINTIQTTIERQESKRANINYYGTNYYNIANRTVQNIGSSGSWFNEIYKITIDGDIGSSILNLTFNAGGQGDKDIYISGSPFPESYATNWLAYGVKLTENANNLTVLGSTIRSLVTNNVLYIIFNSQSEYGDEGCNISILGSQTQNYFKFNADGSIEVGGAILNGNGIKYGDKTISWSRLMELA